MKTTSLLCLAFLVPSSFVSLAQPQTAWVRTYNNNLPNGTNQPVAMKIDGAGNVVVAGSGQDAGGDFDYVVLKYAPDGTKLWEARYATPGGGRDEARALALDSGDNVIVTGTSVTAKYSAAGALLWIANYSGRDVVCSTGVVYAVGGSEVDFSTAKFDLETGTNIWTRTKDWAGGPDVAQKVALDSHGSVYAFGECAYRCNDREGCYMINALLFYDSEGALKKSQPVYFSPAVRDTHALSLRVQGDRIYTLSQQLGTAYSYVVHAYDGQGSNTWWYILDKNEPILPPGLGADLKLDSSTAALVTGYTIDSWINLKSITTIRIANGQKVWKAKYPAMPVLYAYNRGYSLALDKQDNVFVAGVCELQLGKKDMVTIKYSNDGEQLWVKHYNGPANGEDRALAVAIAPDGAIYVAGYSANAQGGTDMVLIKYVETKINATPKTGGDVLLQMNGVPGSSYSFQATSDLQNWLNLTTNTADTTGQATYTDTNAGNLYPFRFYRTLLVP